MSILRLATSTRSGLLSDLRTEGNTMTITREITCWCDTDQCQAKASLAHTYPPDQLLTGWRRMGDRHFCPECSKRTPSLRPDQATMLAQCRERATWVKARNGKQMLALRELFEFGGLLERREYLTQTNAPRYEYKAIPQ